MTPEQLDEIIERSPELFRAKIGELREHIRAAAASELEKASESDNAKPAVRIPCAVVIDLTHSTPVFSVEASVTTRKKVVSEAIATRDPKQLELGIGGAA